MVAAVSPAHLSLNVCNEIMKREIDFTPRTAGRSIMVDWPQILGYTGLGSPWSPLSFTSSLCVAWRYLRSLDSLAAN